LIGNLAFQGMDVKLEPEWKSVLSDEFSKPYFQSLQKFVNSAYANSACFPAENLIFSAYQKCPFSKVKVVILGQDPYIKPGQAQGLSFSVPEGMAFPPSLRNIFKEMSEDLGQVIPPSGNLSHWAEQGVFLLNATLTVQEGTSGSHHGQGWEDFTDATIKALNEREEGIVFLLWGSFAQKKSHFLDERKHLILKAPHPSPLSSYRGFFGSKHFSQCNSWLEEKKQEGILW